MKKIAGLAFAACIAAQGLPGFALAEGGAANVREKQVSGMSVVGNHESPKALVIVPWKSSSLGSPLDVSRTPDDGRQPVDRDVFRRLLDYHALREASREGSAVAAR